MKLTKINFKKIYFTEMDKKFYDEMKLRIQKYNPIAIFVGIACNLDDYYKEVPHKTPIRVFISLYEIDSTRIIGIIKVYNIKGNSISIDSHALKIEVSRGYIIPVLDGIKMNSDQSIIINPVICKTKTDTNTFNTKLNLIPFKVNNEESYSKIDCTLFTTDNKTDRKLSSGIFEISKKLFDEWNLITNEYAFLSNDGIKEYKNYASNKNKVLEQDVKLKEKDLEYKDLLIEKAKQDIEKNKLELEKLKNEIKKLNEPHF